MQEIKPYIYFDNDYGKYRWQISKLEITSKTFSTTKEAEADLMWYLLENRLIKPGESITL